MFTYMNKKPILLASLASLILLSGVVIYNQTNNKTASNPTPQSSPTTKVEEKSETPQTTPAPLNEPRAGTYQDYKQELVANASDGKVVLFFNATWCPTCQATNRDINANLSKIPSKLDILKVDYDTSTDLKKKYGVKFQHTFVKVDKDGNLLTTASGIDTLDQLIDFANRD